MTKRAVVVPVEAEAAVRRPRERAVDRTGPRVCFLAPSTGLSELDRPTLLKTVGLLQRTVRAGEVYLSPHLFTRDELITHIAAPAAERTREFKAAIRDFGVIASVAGGTGAEDIVLAAAPDDFRVIRDRRPLFIGFSDFTFLLNEIYVRCRVPGILFPSLSLGRGHARKMIALLQGEEIAYRGAAWLSAPPRRRISGRPIGGNLTTFVNFLNRERPPRLNWRKHILFIEDVGIDLEDLHRLLAALRRHRVFRRIRALVVGSFCEDATTVAGREFQKRALFFLKTYLADVLRLRRQQKFPLPILYFPQFGHRITPGLPAVPIGGWAAIDRFRRIRFLLGHDEARRGAASRGGPGPVAAGTPAPGPSNERSPEPNGEPGPVGGPGDAAPPHSADESEASGPAADGEPGANGSGPDAGSGGGSGLAGPDADEGTPRDRRH